jgi:hypothetical protein
VLPVASCSIHMLTSPRRSRSYATKRPSGEIPPWPMSPVVVNWEICIGPDSVVPAGRIGNRSFQTASAAITTTAAVSSHGLRHMGRAAGTGTIVPLVAAAEDPLAGLRPDAELVAPLTGTTSLRSAATLPPGAPL